MPNGPPKRGLGVILLLGVAFLMVLYILNFGAGFIELIPDNIPLIGNLDEAAATLVLLASLLGAFSQGTGGKRG